MSTICLGSAYYTNDLTLRNFRHNRTAILSTLLSKLFRNVDNVADDTEIQKALICRNNKRFVVSEIDYSN